MPHHSETTKGYSPFIEKSIIRLIEKNSGITIDNVKRRELKQDISIRMKETGIKSHNLYYSYLTSSETKTSELKKLINLLTINETYFFRSNDQFKILKKVVIPKLIKQKKRKKISIWSAGCSSGEETYSILFTLLESESLEGYQIKILGTDINDDMLRVAQRGIYSGRTLANVSGQLLKKYFEPFLNRNKVKDTCRQHTEFKYLNLVEPFFCFFPEKLDVIFFRNVMIYFNKETCQKILNSFYSILNEGGFLFTGPSESLWEISDKFELCMFEKAFIYRKKSLRKIREPIPQKKFKEKTFKEESVPIKKGKPIGAQPTAVDTSIFDSTENKIRIMLEEAELEMELGDYSKAENILDEVLFIEKNNKSAILLKLILWSNQRKEAKVENYAKEIFKHIPVFPELHFLLGRYYESEGKTNEAITEYKKILFLDTKYLLAREKLLNIYANSGQTSPAQREARNIIEQLKTGNYKNFTHSIQEAVNKERLLTLCKKILHK